MTLRARQVLQDCPIALQLLEEEKDLQRWRIHWVAALALIRAVGHVLDKVDGAEPKIGRAANAAFKKWKGDAPEHEIFREFIDRERNNILKEYEFNLHPEEQVEVALVGALQPVAGGDPIRTAGIFPIGENIYRPLLDGFREGDDARDVLSEAIEWWESELTAIDQAVEATPDVMERRRWPALDVPLAGGSSVPHPGHSFRSNRRYADAPAAALLTGLAAGEWSPLRSRPCAHLLVQSRNAA